MLPVLSDVVLPTLFAACGLFALGVLFASLRHCLADLRAIRMQLNASAETRDFAIPVATTEARIYLPAGRRAVIRRLAVPAPRQRQTGQRAAA